ncbi:MAG: hypothetical protein ABR905_16040 [Terracidiphilus sp.]
MREILANVKKLAVEYYKLTKKPLGVTGEIAEFIAAEELNLTLVDARTEGFDAKRGDERIQIKGRAYAPTANRGQRIGRIKVDAPCDVVLLVLLHPTLEPKQIWEAPYKSVVERLKLGGRAKERGVLSVPEFIHLAGARCVWPDVKSEVGSGNRSL